MTKSYYYETLQYEHYQLSLQLGRSHTTHLASPRHSYTDLSHQDSFVATTFATTALHPKRVSTSNSLSLLYRKASNRQVVPSHRMPHPNLQQDFPNSKVTLPPPRLNLKKVTLTMSIESPQGSTSPPM
jgi:hypothetical protein